MYRVFQEGPLKPPGTLFSWCTESFSKILLNPPVHYFHDVRSVWCREAPNQSQTLKIVTDFFPEKVKKSAPKHSIIFTAENNGTIMIILDHSTLLIKKKLISINRRILVSKFHFFFYNKKIYFSSIYLILNERLIRIKVEHRGIIVRKPTLHYDFAQDFTWTLNNQHNKRKTHFTIRNFRHIL